MASGEVYCWGGGGNSHFGDGGATPTTAVFVEFPGAVTVLGASQYSLCGALAGGGLHCEAKGSKQASFPKANGEEFDAAYFQGGAPSPPSLRESSEPVF